MDYITAGESHGKKLSVIISDVPAGIKITSGDFLYELKRRSLGFGRSDRQSQESNNIDVFSGICDGTTTGSPICVLIDNDVKDLDTRQVVDVARPGHADFAGATKFLTDNCRFTRERSSARETACRVVAGTIAKKFLDCVGVNIYSYVYQIGSVECDDLAIFKKPFELDLLKGCDADYLRMLDGNKSKIATKLINQATENSDTLGGSFRVVCAGVTCGLGSYSSGKDRLNAKLSFALSSIPSVKSVEIGYGKNLAQYQGSMVVDEFDPDNVPYRFTNFSGGIEGGVTNGMPIIVGASVKPFSSVSVPVKSYNLNTGQVEDYAGNTRSDVCAVPSAAVVAESEVALVLANSYMDKFGHDTITEILSNLNHYNSLLDKRE